MGIELGDPWPLTDGHSVAVRVATLPALSTAGYSDAEQGDSPDGLSDDEDERTFDPRAQRSNYSLYPSNTSYSAKIRGEPVHAKLLPMPRQAAASATGPLALFCQYCNWTSKETGIEFDRPGGIHSQLAKMNNGGTPKLTTKDVKERRKDNPDEPLVADEQVDSDFQFASLKAFYTDQLADASTSLGGLPLHDGVGFSSPAALTRIMSLYTGRGHGGRLQKGPPDIMREALNTEEGLKLAQLDESRLIKKLTHEGWEATASREQRDAQVDPAVRFQDDLRPIPYLLRTKRSKRCPVCRHIISKPENKVTSTRFKIRLVAKSYIPNITIRVPLKPLRPYQYILTFKNPLFESIKVTLATPNVTPGRFASKVTILCPQFEVDANTDMWDDALKEDGKDRRSRRGDDAAGGEAGKIWEKGRNWVSIVLEVIPASLRPENQAIGAEDADVDDGPLKEDEDILEIPMFVRMEWEADPQNEVSAGQKEKEAREKRELAYWCVLGVGRISHE
ncbi:hypothetical protein ACCO45_001957 [Purpureocillium lilacinum]|uniref:Uncharacterized protein n=1 Tax=Purpureocillium lilacinum TaxID=33203 RepID=A0ACC4E9R8_PURLI